MSAVGRNRIMAELEKADEFLAAADGAYKRGLYAPAVVLANHSVYHASTAAFLTRGSKKGLGEARLAAFADFFEKFSRKLDTQLERHLADEVGRDTVGSGERAEKEALFRVYQSREFFFEVKDFLRKALR